MSHLGTAAGDAVEYFKCRHQFIRAIYLDLDTTAAQCTDQFRELIGTGAETRKILRPGGHHLPVHGLLRSHRCHGVIGLLLSAPGQYTPCQHHTAAGRAEKIASFHSSPCSRFDDIPGTAQVPHAGHHEL